MLYQQGQKAEALDMIAQAIDCYKIALKINPAHGESIAALGRLRFVAPPQPYFNELKNYITAEVYEVTLEVRNPCNYRCHYCVAAGHNNVPVQRFDLDAIKAFYEGLGDNLIVTTLECEGGEPTVHPQFPELIRLISRYSAVSFPSNNSQDPKRWLPEETASRLMIRSSLHPQAEEDLPKYLRHARYLLDKGCIFNTTFVSHPARMDKIPEYKTMFAEAGVPFSPVGFIGLHDGKKYPNMYSDAEKEMIGINDTSRYWLHQIEPHTTRVRRFRGIPCLSGYRSFYLSNKGTLRRCAYDKRPMDAPFTEAKPCDVKICGCGLLLEKLNNLTTGEFYNNWASTAGKKPMDIDFDALAQKHGYENGNDAMAKEQTLMYDALMAAYGKDEFVE